MRMLLFAALAALALPAVAAATEIVPFRTPSGNIECMYAAIDGKAWVRCDIRSGLVPVPRGRCELDWTGLSVGRTGRGTPTCAGDTTHDAHARVIPYGKSFRRGGFVCASAVTGLTCKNRGGHGFFLSRQRWRVF